LLTENLSILYKILDILDYEGKKFIMDIYKFKENPSNMDDELKEDLKTQLLQFIKSPEFFITNFDLFLLMEYYKIPTILLSQKKILFLFNHVLTMYGNLTDQFVFIITSATRNKVVLSYQILYNTNETNIFLPLDILKTDKREIIFDSIQNKFNIQRFLDIYVIQKLNYYKKYNQEEKIKQTKKIKTKTRKTKKKSIISKSIIPVKFYTNSSDEEKIPTKKYSPIILEDDSSSD
jgi:hypothetical protein